MFKGLCFGMLTSNSSMGVFMADNLLGAVKDRRGFRRSRG